MNLKHNIQFSGISATTLEVKPDGTMDLNDIEQAIRVKGGYVQIKDESCDDLEVTSIPVRFRFF